MNNVRVIPSPKQDKPLASTLLAEAPEILKTAEQTDVASFREWLLDNPSKPLVCIGNGGKHTSYPALLYEMNAGWRKRLPRWTSPRCRLRQSTIARFCYLAVLAGISTLTTLRSVL